VLALGVTAEATWDPDGPSKLLLTSGVAGSLTISEDVARRLVADRAGLVRVRLTHQLPVGQGFGMSAAGAVATGLSLANLFRISRQHALEVAHLADLFGGGGLGGVAAILGGGLETRIRAGIPPYGRVLHRPFLRKILIGVVGRPIPSPRLLRNPEILGRISSAAEQLPTSPPGFTPSGFLAASERFTDEVGLTTAGLARTLRAVRACGGWAAQAMFGRSFFVVPKTPGGRARIVAELERRGHPFVEVSASSVGAMPLRGGSRPESLDGAAASILTGRPSGPPP